MVAEETAHIAEHHAAVAWEEWKAYKRHLMSAASRLTVPALTESHRKALTRRASVHHKAAAVTAATVRHRKPTTPATAPPAELDTRSASSSIPFPSTTIGHCAMLFVPRLDLSRIDRRDGAPKAPRRLPLLPTKHRKKGNDAIKKLRKSSKTLEKHAKTFSI